ncbi:glutathione S-transferase T3-like protein [Tanacetum coccineum]|uniref:Glutathione S-transferase T3-like protein n=1 Tax=Tanacetum coccineum TaxID=301880 RepID=A0ABQ5DRG3_9ASTR
MGNSLDRLRMRDVKPEESVNVVVADVEQDGVKFAESVAVVSDLEQGSVKPESVAEVNKVEQGKEKEEEEGEGLTLKAIANKLRNRLFLWKQSPYPSRVGNTGYWQQPNPDDSPVEQVATSPTKKKVTRNRQKRVNETEPAPRQTAWTTEKEIALAKGWRSVSENSERGNARKKDGFWVEVLEYIESKTKQEGRRTYDMVVGKWKVVRPAVVRFCGIYSNVMRMAQESGAGDEDYIQKAMIHYQAECGLPFKFRHCWEVLKDSPKFQEIAFPNFNQGSQGSSKRQKSSGSSSFNAESGDASINLNNTVNDEDDVQEIRRPEGRDKAKNKGSKASGSSTMNDDALARLMVTELTAAEVAQREKFMELKRREVECREREIAAAEYRAQQEDMRLYLQSYEHLTADQRLAMDAIKAQIKAKYNLQF